MTITSGTPRPRLRVALASLAVAGLTAATAAVVPASAGAAEQRPAGPTIALPDGFQPEGIATGRGPTAYLGSLADGDIYALDLRSGEGSVVSDGPGTSSVGLKVDSRQHRLYVAGGGTGTARVVDLDSGDVLADLQLTDGPAFINDVVLTRRAAWFTNSAAPEIYRVPLQGTKQPAGQRRVRTIELTGEWVQPDGFGANGITETPDGTALLVVNSTDGTLFRVPKKGARAGVAVEADLGGQSLTNGDGMLLRNRTLYVVRNRLNKVVQLRLDRRGLSGRRTGVLRSAGFDVPTTIAAARGRLYLPNARFGTEPTPETPYTVSVLKRR